MRHSATGLTLFCYDTSMKIFLVALAILSIYLAIEYLHTSYLIRIGEGLAAAAVPFSRTTTSSQRILIIGDSTAVGTGASSPETSLAGLLGGHYPQARIENLGVNGSKIHDLITRFTSVENERYDLIEIHIGGNDIVRFTELTKVEQDVKTVLSQARKLSNNVVLVTSGNVGTSLLLPTPSRLLFTKRTRSVREIFIRVAKEQDVSYVDLFHEAKEDPFAKDPSKYYAKDFFHPSDAGYQFWFDQIRPHYPMLQ